MSIVRKLLSKFNLRKLEAGYMCYADKLKAESTSLLTLSNYITSITRTKVMEGKGTYRVNSFDMKENKQKKRNSLKML